MCKLRRAQVRKSRLAWVRRSQWAQVRKSRLARVRRSRQTRARKLQRVLGRKLRPAVIGWAVVAAGPLSTGAVVMVSVAGLVSVVVYEAGAEEPVVEEARSPRRRCMTARCRYRKRVAETC